MKAKRCKEDSNNGAAAPLSYVLTVTMSHVLLYGRQGL